MPRTRKLTRAFTGLAFSLLLILVGCSPAGGPTGEPSSPSASPSPDAPTAPAFDLTAPGNARQIVDLLRTASGNRPILRVEITDSTANITYLDNETAQTIGFANGAVSKLDSTIAYIHQAEFDPDSFAIDDVGKLFDEAGAISGSRERQDLQINEYDKGNVIMTVTTTPESSTVFFRADGSAIHPLDFRTTAGIAEGLSDTVRTAPQVTAIVIKPDSLSVDVRAEPGTIQRRTRQKALPTIIATLKDSGSGTQFSPSLVQPAVIARLTDELPARLNKPASTSVQVTIEQRSGEDAPRMRFQVGGTEVDTTLAGEILAGK
ncbi:hypothetical protein SAMN05443377_10758 [Propionibacterium cyclohexanicum]|uniref:Uncharacterized protein n=2 Tax=Propionibacterium cyclohexanicum TaxID=64702 RepID=A0A1H9RGN3_9ACTN|nr:hypothetical protein SAMN05443377_10758 [Propionibacterium cyclohexanicum]